MGVRSSYDFISWYSIGWDMLPLVPWAPAVSARSCSLAFGRHPPGLVHPRGPTRRVQDKGGPFRVGDSSTFETLLWEVANGHWAVQKIGWRSCACRKIRCFFLVFVIANETFWSSCLLKTECVFVCSYISLFSCLRRIVSSGTEVL